MFKSVLTKYMVAIVAIIFVSFLLLASIVNVTLIGYATDTVQGEVEHRAKVAARGLGDMMRGEGERDINRYVAKHRAEASAILSDIVGQNSETVLFVTDTQGAILISLRLGNGEIPEIADGRMPEDVMRSVRESGTVGTADEPFRVGKEELVSSGAAVESEDGKLLGAAFACSFPAREMELVRKTNRTVTMTCIWVMLAAMIAVYFISDRVTNPLRKMTDAAKEYARGNLDTRVEITGKDEVAELAEAFNNMAEFIAENEKMRNSFLANVSHDLRTPMTTIAGFVDGMISGAIPQEKQPEYLEIVSSEVHRLSRLVSRLLDISRLESGERKFTFARFDLTETARLILISFERQIEEKGLEVEFRTAEESMYAFGDSDATHQILYNLIENAIKFARKDGILRIEIARADGGALAVTVYDEGEGIPEEDLPHVFERFYKTDKSRGLDKTGVGLGLYIVKTMLEAMHESITAESVPGSFCSFRFTLREDKSEN